MSRLAAELLDLLVPTLPPSFTRPGTADLLRGAAPFLAPVPRLGFECRLGASGGPVDLSQHLRAAEDGPALLGALARARANAAAPGSREAWLRIGQFAEAWSASGPPGAGRVDEVWLEYDLDVPCGPPTLPSVFAAFTADAGSKGLAHTLALLAPRGAEAADALARCLDQARRLGARPHGVVGVMLARGGEVRGVVRGLTPSAGEALLRRIGWAGPAEAVGAALHRYAPLAADAGLAVGFAPGPGPAVGIELLAGTDAGAADRLRALLAALARDGVCTADQVAALRGWGGSITPMGDGGWPQALVAASLTQPQGRLGILSRFVNHVKLGVAAGRPLAAKAYLGCVHTWHEQAKGA